MRFAQIQHGLGIKGSYYFRAVPKSWNEEIINEISSLGHEVGYHYENMDTCRGDVDKAWDDFRYHLDKLRKLTDVKTGCMHGSPRSEFDNKEIWKKYDYKSLGLAAEKANLPSKIMFTVHPQRWHNNNLLWAKELLLQNLKNIVKRLFFVK